MMLQPALLALAFLSSQGSGQVAGLFPPKPAAPVVGADFTGWHGWSYLQGAPSVWPNTYETSGDWSDIEMRLSALKPTKPSVWRMKVVIFTRIESDGRDAAGVLRERRGTIESVQLAQIRVALLRLNAYAATKFDGEVSINQDVQVESEWMRDAGPAAFGADFARRYFESRINGGTYEAEDKVFRGPFNSVIYILPGSASGELPDVTVNETPVSGVPAAPIGRNGVSYSLDKALRNAWFRQLEFRAKAQGFKSLTVAPGAATNADAWAAATNLEEVPAQTFLPRLSTSLDLHASAEDPGVVLLPESPATTAKLVADPEKGQVLKVVEASGIREGGLALPSRADGKPIEVVASTPTLCFDVKSICKDPLAIRLDSSDGKTAWVSIGTDPVLVTPMPDTVVASVPFISDGKWQKVAVDLRPIAKQAGFTDIVRLSIEPSPNAKLAGKAQPEPVDYSFSDFRFNSDPAGPFADPVSPSATSADPEARALFAAQAKAASPDLAALLKDKSELVRLNATTAYIGFKDPTVEEQLIANSLDLDPSVAAAALTALSMEGTDTARAVVMRSVSVSLSDYAKMTAGKLLADTKDPKMAEVVSRLLANRSWQAHVQAVESLAVIKTPESQQFRLGFIGMSDPAVKLAVTENADPSLDRVASALLWSAVNEPSDAVRAESYIKLIQSPVATNKTEGYKGVRDDSKFVRKLVLEYLAAHPTEDNRNALRTAVADRSASVRAAAILGFAALDAGATNDEIANVLDDPDPNVQLALIELSKKKAMKLPQKTVDAMLASPDTRVSAAAKGLTGSNS